MTIQSALISAIKKLRHKNLPSAHLDVEVLLSAVLNKQTGYLIAHQEKEITAGQLKKFYSLISRRQNGTPIPYLTNHQWFYGLDFYVDKRVMIPRPETELLVEEAIKYSRLMYHKLYAIKRQPVMIADIGTGSGCLAVTLAKYLTSAKIYASDLSEKALAVAKINAKKHKVLKRIKFLQGDLLTPLGSSRAPARLSNFDIIVANLPYLTADEAANLPHEPKQALDGGKLGLEIMERLLKEALNHLNTGGKIFLEISPVQTKAIEYMVEQQMPAKKVEFKKDLTGRDRLAVVW